MTTQATSARSGRTGDLPYDAITVNLVRLAGLPKAKARECEEIVRHVLAAHVPPARPELPEDPIELLDRVRQNYTRDDDLPDDLLPRIDAVIEAAQAIDHFPDPKEMIATVPSPSPLLVPTNRDRCGSGFEQERPTPPFAPEPSNHRDSELRWPQTPQDVKDMIGSSFAAAKFVNQGNEIGMHTIPAHEMDTYTVTAHDLLEAFGHWRDFAAPNAACRDGDHFGDANEMVESEPTVELHVPVRLSQKQRSKLLDGVCALITRHDVPVERVRLVATYDGMALGRRVPDEEAAKCPLAICWLSAAMALVDEHGAAMAGGNACVAQAKRDAIRTLLIDSHSSGRLPQLPEPHWPRYYQGAVPSGAFSKDQMHEYARDTLALNGLAAPLVHGLGALSDEQLRDALMQSLDATMKRCDVHWHHWRNWAGTWTFATDLVPVVRQLAKG